MFVVSKIQLPYQKRSRCKCKAYNCNNIRGYPFVKKYISFETSQFSHYRRKDHSSENVCVRHERWTEINKSDSTVSEEVEVVVWKWNLKSRQYQVRPWIEIFQWLLWKLHSFTSSSILSGKRHETEDAWRAYPWNNSADSPRIELSLLALDLLGNFKLEILPHSLLGQCLLMLSCKLSDSASVSCWWPPKSRWICRSQKHACHHVGGIYTSLF